MQFVIRFVKTWHNGRFGITGFFCIKMIIKIKNCNVQKIKLLAHITWEVQVFISYTETAIVRMSHLK